MPLEGGLKKSCSAREPAPVFWAGCDNACYR